MVKRVRDMLGAVWQKAKPVLGGLFKVYYFGFYLPQIDVPGIYVFYGDSYVYVGSSVSSVKRRLGKHLSDLRRDTHHNTPLQERWDQGEGFICVMVEALPEDCPLSLVEQRENFWIALYGVRAVNIPNSTHRRKRT
jgi:hypothetical protein